MIPPLQPIVAVFALSLSKGFHRVQKANKLCEFELHNFFDKYFYVHVENNFFDIGDKHYSLQVTCFKEFYIPKIFSLSFTLRLLKGQKIRKVNCGAYNKNR